MNKIFLLSVLALALPVVGLAKNTKSPGRKIASESPSLKDWNPYIECQAEVSSLSDTNENNMKYFPGPDSTKYQRISFPLGSTGRSAEGNAVIDIGNGEQISLALTAESIAAGSAVISGNSTVTRRLADGSTKVIRWDQFLAANDGPDHGRVYYSDFQMNPELRQVEINQYMPTHGGKGVMNGYGDLVKANLVPVGTVFGYEVSCLYLKKGNHL